MNLPSLQKCEDLLDYYCVPENVRAHCHKVKEIAVFLGNALNEKGLKINTELVRVSALLHDIAKVIDFEEFPPANNDCVDLWKNLKKRFSGMDHTQAVVYLLADFPEVADVIRRHAYRAVIKNDLYPASWEAKIVTYADKRVAHEKIVPLKERFEEGCRRWEKKGSVCDAQLTKKINNEYYKIERDIFSHLEIEPVEIK
ncbi:MAG: HD domain-containing protein [Nanobdellota archaeon]